MHDLRVSKVSALKYILSAFKYIYVIESNIRSAGNPCTKAMALGSWTHGCTHLLRK